MDTLTTISSRKEFLSRLDREIRTHQQADAVFAVLILNVKGFRSINSVYGYECADRVLEKIAESIQSLKRSQDISGHVGTDEFALILPELKGPYLAELAVIKLLSSMENITLDDGRSVDIKLHAGISLFPQHGDTSETLLQQADSAMQSARDTYQPYTLARNTEHPETTTSLLIPELERAIKNNEFELYYQPKVDLRTHRMLGAEALMRWKNPERGFIGPDEFITLAEKNGLIFPMTLWSLNTALRHSAEVRKLWPDYRVAVNLSAATLTEIELVELVKRALGTWDSAADSLVIEVTESAVMKDPDASINTLNGLRDLGIILSIDDFGTGYSSLSYLKQLPVRELKIDKSFIMEIATDADDKRLVQTMIHVAESFQLNVIAEGIEDEQTLQLLIDMGCHHGQGFHIAKPMEHEKLLDWISVSEWTSQAPGKAAT